MLLLLVEATWCSHLLRYAPFSTPAVVVVAVLAASSAVWWLHPSPSSPLLILMPFSCRQHLEPYCVVVLFVGTVWMHSGFNVQCLSFFFVVRIVDYKEKTWAKYKVVITTCKREFQLFLCYVFLLSSLFGECVECKSLALHWELSGVLLCIAIVFRDLQSDWQQV